jgi:hypothetical protein
LEVVLAAAYEHQSAQTRTSKIIQHWAPR